MKHLVSCILILTALSGSLPLGAQGGESERMRTARAAQAECIAHAEGGESVPKREARASYEKARRAFLEVVGAEPRNADAHAGLGETLSRCGVPLASMMSVLGLLEESSSALERALELDASHWLARYVLAMNSYHMPAFLNRLAEAIRHLEVLQRQQGERSDRPEYALVHLRLGDAYARTGRHDEARASFALGSRLFPDHAGLRERAGEVELDHGTAGAGDGGGAVVGAGAAGESAGAEPVAHAYALAPLRIEVSQQQLDGARSGTSLRRVDVYTMPGGTGEMLQTLQSLPGTTRAGDGADLYIRGGDPEETPVFLNGGRLAFPGRWEGLSGSTMGVLDANVLSRAYFSAGGFSAKYGNALSGVVDVEAHGRPESARGRVGANLVSVGGSLFRPIAESAGAWGTLMLTDVRLVARMQGVADSYPDVPQSYQAVVGGGAAVAGLDLKAVALASGDRSSRRIDAGGFTGAFASAGSTQHAALTARWLSEDSRRGVLASVTGSRRGGGFDFGVLARRRVDTGLGVRVDGDMADPSGARLRAGLEAGRHDAVTEGAVPATRNVAPGSPVRVLGREHADAAYAGAYLEAEGTLGPLVAVAGLRADVLPGEDRVTLDPRGALAFTSGQWTLRAGGGIFHQGRWRRAYDLPGSGAPQGVPTRARHLVIGAERAGEPALKVEAFGKRYDEYVAEEGGALDIGRGSARGVDGILRWQRQERLNGWVTYSLIDAQLRLVDGAVAPGAYDVTHSLTGVGRLAVSDLWELGSTVRYATGKPYTSVVGTTAPAQEGWPEEPVFGAPHGERLPRYFRVDGRVTRYARFGFGTGVFYLEMLNLNGRRNVMGYQYDAEYSEKRPVDSFFARRTFVLGAELEF